MTQFDTIFDNAAREAGFSWDFFYGDRVTNVIANRFQEDFPNIQRTFNETVRPLFDNLKRVTRKMDIYIIKIGFLDETNSIVSDNISQGLEEIMIKFVTFRDLLRRNGIEVELTEDPFPTWLQFDCNEYGYVFKFNCTYSLC